jgi:RNase P subunit RPR2
MPVRRCVFLSLMVAGSLAAAAAAPASESPRLLARAYCDNITADEISRLLKAITAENAAREKAVAEAKAKKSEADAAATRAGTAMMNDMAKTGECKDAFMEKDPRSKEVQRLYDLATAASEKGNEKLSEQYSEKANKIQEALDIDADRACGGKGASFMDTCRKEAEAKDPRSAERSRLERLAAEAAKKSDTAASERYTEEAKQVAAQMEAAAAMECVVKMTAQQVGAEGVAANQASNEASQMLSNAQNSGTAEGQAAGNFTEDEYGRIKECVYGRINLPAGTPMNAQSASSIDQRAPELKAALGIK